jgi:hypothetical protein
LLTRKTNVDLLGLRFLRTRAPHTSIIVYATG